MSWTQKELEELYQKINKALKEDPDFREKARKDARAAVEELAGRPLEEGFRLNFIEQDAGCGDTYVLPEFVGEELDPRELGAIAGGKNVKSVAGGDCPKDSTANVSVVVIVSACAAAGCAADAGCGGQACGSKACGGHAVCTNNVCAADGCVAHAGCAGKGCLGDACGAHAGCAAKGCIGDACAAFAGCVAEGCRFEVCPAHAEPDELGGSTANPLSGPSYDFNTGFGS